MVQDWEKNTEHVFYMFFNSENWLKFRNTLMWKRQIFAVKIKCLNIRKRLWGHWNLLSVTMENSHQQYGVGVVFLTVESKITFQSDYHPTLAFLLM